MKKVIKMATVRDNVILPTKVREDAGFDVYASFDEPYICIYPNCTEIIHTGIISSFDKGFAIILKERGSTGTKGMGQRSGVIDSGYRGEWMVPITNHSEDTIVIAKKGADISEFVDVPIVYPYEKAICQAVFIKLPDVTIKKCSVAEIYSEKSSRGIGCLGSSGK